MRFFANGCETAPDALPGQGDIIGIATPPDLDALAALPAAAEMRGARTGSEAGNRFEGRDGYDAITLNVPDAYAPEEAPKRVDIHFYGGRLYILHDDVPAARALEDELACPQPPDGGKMTPEQALYRFFVLLTAKDAPALQKMEEEIAALEDELMKDLPDDCTERISALRKRLLALKRYYEGLFDLLEDLEENGNGLFGKKELKAFRLQTNRADRLSRNVLNLRDYVTQVREAYQNQLDIRQNEIMKLFTTVTAVCLPLTLIAGWFGMNLQMPEYSMPYAYPVVIAVSALVVLASIWYFWKHKWF